MEGHDTPMDWKIQYIKDFSSLQINPQSNAIPIKFSKKKFSGLRTYEARMINKIVVF